MKLTYPLTNIRTAIRLTLTWDVLKYIIKSTLAYACHWLTLTWDVLKLWCAVILYECFFRLTLTWDVLK